MLKLVEAVIEDMDKQLERIVKSMVPLDDSQIWSRARDTMNSIGNLCLHLAGNERMNLISAIGGQTFTRERSKEFTTEGGIPREELIRLLTDTRTETKEILARLTEEDLDREVAIHYGLEDWNRMLRVQAEEGETYEIKEIGKLLVAVAAHYGYHTGQIVLLSKLLKDTGEHITGQYH
ncbi:DinB family protein [Paenibacillus jiagnxiensis]|uniref:DinB family protein n=1 Tax=Paenibacillus jiagnxiensis TaxID=3228926 RepID=UPI0033B26381